MSDLDWMWWIVGLSATAGLGLTIWLYLVLRSVMADMQDFMDEEQQRRAKKLHRYLATDMDTVRPRWKRKPR